MSQFSPVIFDPAVGGIRNATSNDNLNIATSNSSVDSFTNANAGTINKGQAVFIKTSGSVDLAKADASGTAQVVGLVFDTTISTGAVGNVVIEGPVTLTTAQWDAIAGTTGGLTAGVNYFLSSTVAGSLTATCPSAAGKYAEYVGQAASATTLYVSAGFPFAL